MLCDGVPAGDRVAWCVKNMGLSSEEARLLAALLPCSFGQARICDVRQRVMREFCANFGEKAGITAATWCEFATVEWHCALIVLLIKL